MDIDWSKAPEWAEAHALYAFGGEINEAWIGAEQYQRLDHQRPFPYGDVGVDGAQHNPCRSWFKYATPRPAAWTGEGLPPVGLEAEYGSDEHGWKKVIVLAHFGNGGNPSAVAQLGELGPIMMGTQKYWRPTRTPEQIAADKRLHEIRNALSAINSKVHFPNDLVRGNILAAAVEAMIDEGYRKLEIVDE